MSPKQYNTTVTNTPTGNYRPVRPPDRHPDVVVPFNKAIISALLRIAPWCAIALIPIVLAVSAHIELLTVSIILGVWFVVSLVAFLFLLNKYWCEHSVRLENTLYEHEELKFQGYKGEPEKQFILVNGSNKGASIIEQTEQIDENLLRFIRGIFNDGNTGMNWAWEKLHVDRNDYREYVRILEGASMIEPKGKGWTFKEKYKSADQVIKQLFPNYNNTGFLNRTI